MVIYYSGTGNSTHVARRIAENLGDEALDLFDRLRTNDTSALRSDRPWIVVTPTYAWRIPRIVREHLDKTEFLGSRQFYFVMTCGDEIGNAPMYIRRHVKKLGYVYMGCAEVIMPENYIAMFSAPDPKEAAEIVVRAHGTVDCICERIKNGERLDPPKARFIDRVYSGIVNDAFYPVFVKAKKFRVGTKCIGCGKCEKVCPTNNIKLVAGRPVWGDNCTHCMACICRCPTEAIEYGRHTKGLRRYYLDK